MIFFKDGNIIIHLTCPTDGGGYRARPCIVHVQYMHIPRKSKTFEGDEEDELPSSNGPDLDISKSYSSSKKERGKKT